ncbi:hypothetical protein [Ferrimicrobium acidiphilum]|jgi:quercetin dioxygenase-like cupin family protein|uniref:hypothetical protein n=1 Tax=Ferrimicrobium acidiphilum TaxID=121039 RepID=UPI0023F25F7F|nr:hypothetical protein [Ferrimicrobium acidiphilum]MCL5054054.1 cupin [Gammaproteobacteria bacterium]
MTFAQATQHANDSRCRTTTWVFAEGAATGQHIHEFDYIVIPVTGGSFHVVDATGETHDMHQEAGVPYVGTKGTAHNVINQGSTTAIFVEVELKESL